MGAGSWSGPWGCTSVPGERSEARPRGSEAVPLGLDSCGILGLVVLGPGMIPGVHETVPGAWSEAGPRGAKSGVALTEGNILAPGMERAAGLRGGVQQIPGASHTHPRSRQVCRTGVQAAPPSAAPHLSVAPTCSTATLTLLRRRLALNCLLSGPKLPIFSSV